MAYNVSKAFTVAITKALAKENEGKCFINACCPGWVNTDMGVSHHFDACKPTTNLHAASIQNLIGDAPKSLTDGAKIPVRLAVGDCKNATGQFWENPNVTDTGDGDISVW